MQDDNWRQSIPISEDCLHLNVFTSNLKTDERYSELRPVIVFLHGGGFEAGSAMNYGPEYLMESE
jgi:carboxylesterase type B